MKNLAGDMDCDEVIRKELEEARIEIVQHPKQLQNEVPATLTGQLAHKGGIKFTFVRAWYYWVVHGEVPLKVAQKMYADPMGKKDVRVAGHCGCPPPEEWAFPKTEVLVKLGIYKPPDDEHPYGQTPTYGELAKMCNSGEIKASRYVETYHIDSQEGLNLFVKTMKKHRLVS